MTPETFRLIADGQPKRVTCIATARIAGIMAVKRTHELIPLCHPLAVTKVTVEFEPLAGDRRPRVDHRGPCQRPDRRRDGSVDRRLRRLPDAI